MDVHVPTCDNLTDDLVRNGSDHPRQVVVRRRVGPHHEQVWVDVTAAQLLDDVRAVAKGLVAAGLTTGDRVVLMSSTRYEWTLLDYAIWYAGAVTVPLYETSSVEQVQWVLEDSGARAALVETEDHAARVQDARAGVVALEHVWTIDQEAIGELRVLGLGVTDEEIERRRGATGPDHIATVIYTSGTTGAPKGCVLTHRHLDLELAVTLDQLSDLFEPTASETGEGLEQPTTLLFLPLAHVFARVVQIGAIRARVCLAHSSDVKLLVPDLAAIRPTFLLAVPRVLEKLFTTASQRAVADGQGGVFDRAAATAISWSRAHETGKVPWRLRARHRVFERLVYARLRETLGGRCRFAISGGAPLGERLGHFFRGTGITVLEGYGLTETTAALTLNTPQVHKLGTVGRPLPGASVRVADDGELLLRGGQVFAGYWHDDEATAATLDDHGWLRSGDLGEIDDEGFVRITGRKKEILVTAGGKNISPAVLEDHIRAHPLVDQALVVGDGQPFVAALVTLDRETVPAWASHHRLPTDPARLVTHPLLLAEIQAAVDEANASVSQAEAVRSFTVLPSTWSEEGGQLTPSLKLRRTVVLREHRDDVDTLYAR